MKCNSATSNQSSAKKSIDSITGYAKLGSHTGWPVYSPNRFTRGSHGRSLRPHQDCHFRYPTHSKILIGNNLTLLLLPSECSSMPSTKKLLTAFNPAKPDSPTIDVLIPWVRDGQRILRGLSSGKESALGMMVYTGRSITENDVFAKLVNSGAVIMDTAETLALLRSYLEQLQFLKIGNVARLSSTEHLNEPNVILELVATTPSAAVRTLSPPKKQD